MDEKKFLFAKIHLTGVTVNSSNENLAKRKTKNAN